MKATNGILLVEKPSGPTSHDVVNRLRKLAGIRRVGHAGTLDPFASGLLLTLLGPATRLSEFFLGMDKEYEADVLLGRETRTHDPEGDVVSESEDWRDLTPADLEEALAGLRGRILQTPPAFSAKKVRGETAHRRVRRGETVKLDPRPVEVHSLELLAMDLPRLRLRIRCSSGTYVRALARDLGRGLAVGACLTSLRRMAIDRFSLESACALEDLASVDDIIPRLVAPAAALSHLPGVWVDPDEARRLRQGQIVQVSGHDLPEDAPIRVLLGDELVAVAARRGAHLRPRKVFGVGSGSQAAARESSIHG